MNTYITVGGYSRNLFDGLFEPRIIVTQAPLRAFLLNTLADLVCYYTNHRWCGTWLIAYIRQRVHAHEESFEFAVTDETLTRYAVWRGWATWADQSDEDTNEYQS